MALRLAGARYHGWIANAMAPAIFARGLVTVHVPRRFYVQSLPGIPTIRVFEALACGIPLVCAPWADCEGLFRPGEAYLVAQNPGPMRRWPAALRAAPAMPAAFTAKGLDQVRTPHGFYHRPAD